VHFRNMSLRNNKQRMAYVRQLPIDATEEEMKQLCAQVGEVVNFKIVYDRETGKSKGCGYCEYRDTKLVDAAVELLDGFEHKGTRLRVQRADSLRHSSSSTMQSGKDGSKKKRKAPSSKRKSVDEITRVVAGFSTAEKREILSQMKALIMQKDGQKGARDILMETPQLAQALLLIQIEFNLVKPEDIKALTHNVSNQSPRRNTQSHSHSHSHPHSQSASASQSQSQSQSVSQSQSQSMNTSPQKAAPQKEATTKEEEKSNAPASALKSRMTDQQRDAFERVMKMSDAYIATLPETQQKAIHKIKAQAQKKMQTQNLQ